MSVSCVPPKEVDKLVIRCIVLVPRLRVNRDTRILGATEDRAAPRVTKSSNLQPLYRAAFGTQQHDLPCYRIHRRAGDLGQVADEAGGFVEKDAAHDCHPGAASRAALSASSSDYRSYNEGTAKIGPRPMWSSCTTARTPPDPEPP